MKRPEGGVMTRMLREKLLAATMARRGCGREEAEVILDRVAARLDGYTHEEVAKMHPLPRREEASE